ncbi:UNVERIFIED_CONTAM: hypothetical protein HDU68_002736 [Siphonaria sp. JEL0065]|nr:hypothetical protein HDU68_002736 [Siphonaria sp. JEL0065]
MGLITFIIKSVIFVYFVKWIVRTVKSAKPGPWNIQYNATERSLKCNRSNKGKGPKFVFYKNSFEPPIDLLDGLVIDTPIFKFNSDNNATSSTSSSSTSTYFTTPTTLPNGRISYEIELPGFTKDELLLSFQEPSTIFIKGTKPGDASIGRKERVVDLKISLLETADVNDIHAAMAEGVLTLSVGQKSNEGRRIVIE